MAKLTDAELTLQYTRRYISGFENFLYSHTTCFGGSHHHHHHQKKSTSVNRSMATVSCLPYAHRQIHFVSPTAHGLQNLRSSPVAVEQRPTPVHTCKQTPRTRTHTDIRQLLYKCQLMLSGFQRCSTASGLLCVLGTSCID